MRDILFRGKRVDNGEWVYGSLLKQAGEYISKDEVTPNECWICGMRGEKALIVSETIGRYTGLCDKNGLTRIFEHDVCRVCLGIDTFYIGRIYYDERVAAFGIDYGNGKCNLLSDIIIAKGIDTWIEVIGNIHDNPELLKGE